MNRPVIRMIKVPVVTMVKLVGKKVRAQSVLYILKIATTCLLFRSLHSGN